MKKNEQDSPIQIQTLNTKKQDASNLIEKQNTDNRYATNPSIPNQTLTQDKIYVELIKKILNEKKTTLSSLRKQDWKKSR